MKRLLTLISFCLLVTLSGKVQAQISTNVIDCKSEFSADWELYFFNESFTVEYKVIPCDPEMGYDKEYILLRFTNLTSSKLTLQWHLHAYYNGTCKTCDYPEEYTFVLDMAPLQIMEGDCTLACDHRLKIFKRFNDQNYTKGDVLTAFNFENLKFRLID